MPNFVNFPAEKRQSTTNGVESDCRQWYRSVRQAASRLDGTLYCLRQVAYTL